MSFLKPKDTIDEGDTVLIYISINSIHAIEATETIANKHGDQVPHVFQTNFGALNVKNIIGVAYGSRVALSKGWAYVLQPNPDLWTQTLPHRTQIIYTPDISMILYQLDINPGSIVVESGTGSGSVSHHFMHRIKPSGHLFTFDFHAERVEQARQEFIKHGLGDLVTVEQRDVLHLGFPEELYGKADAVFLDLPAPKLAISFAAKVLKPETGRLCNFSPCIEQSQGVCLALEELGFTDIISLEILQQELIVKQKSLPVINLDFVKHGKNEIIAEEIETNETSESDSPKTENDAIKNNSSEFSPKNSVKTILTTYAPPSEAGHTGYLTFATMPQKCNF